MLLWRHQSAPAVRRSRGAARTGAHRRAAEGESLPCLGLLIPVAVWFCDMTTGLAGRIAVVTGVAHGIGTAIAQALSDVGATVHGVDRDTADLSDPAAVHEFFGPIGPVDILVNNAGGVVGQVGQPLEEVSDADWRSVVDANLMTAFLCT